MARIVMKFGGDIRRRYRPHSQCGGGMVKSARSWPDTRSRWWSLAMAGSTNQAGRAGCARPRRPKAPISTSTTRAKYDAVVSSGEQVTSGLLALVLQSMGVQRPLLAGLADSHPRRQRAWRGAYPRDRRRPLLIERFRRGAGCGDRRLPGHRSGQSYRHARTGRVGHQRGGDRCRRRRRPLATSTPHKNDGRWRLHQPDPRIEAEGAPAGQDFLRGNAGDGFAPAPRCFRVALGRAPPWFIGVRTFVRSSFEDPDAPGMGEGGFRQPARERSFATRTRSWNSQVVTGHRPMHQG